jgi:hypothetical protein
VAYEEQVIEVALEVGKRVLVHATGHPARIVAVGVAAGIAAVATGVGYGAYRGGVVLLGLVKKAE